MLYELADLAARFAATAGGSFLGVDWGAFVVVLLVVFVAAVVIVVSYATGIRLLGAGAPLDGSDERAPASEPAVRVGRRPFAATMGAYSCFAIAFSAVLYGIWLIVPQFH
jgi:hypothetical protein